MSKSYYLRIILQLQLLEKGKVLIDHFDKYIVSHGGGGGRHRAKATHSGNVVS